MVSEVVGVFETDLDRVMVDIADRQLGRDFRKSHCLELQICHGAGSVLREGLVDTDRNFRSRISCAFDDMRFQQFLYQ